MDEKVLLLESSIRRDMEVIAAIYGEIARRPEIADADEDTLIVIAYHLHNLYNAFENIFLNIAALFENTADEVARWHSQLLERMRLDLMPLRPAVIDDVAYDALDEPRRFRPLFRHAYGIRLDRARLRLVLDKALTLRQVYPALLERFLAFLRTLAG
ncbi:MAG: hypothetical protein ACP5OO_09435 [Chloroflexia bacterium]